MSPSQVLVVDDDRSILYLVAELLSDEGYVTRLAEGGREALETFEAGTPDLVLLDMRMPVLDGWGFADQMRARGFDVPILVMTAAQNARQWAEEIEAAGYIEKPFDLDDLIRAVERLVPQSQGEASGGTTLLAALGRWLLPPPRLRQPSSA